MPCSSESVRAESGKTARLRKRRAERVVLNPVAIAAISPDPERAKSVGSVTPSECYDPGRAKSVGSVTPLECYYKQRQPRGRTGRWWPWCLGGGRCRHLCNKCAQHVPDAVPFDNAAPAIHPATVNCHFVFKELTSKFRPDVAQPTSFVDAGDVHR